MRAFLLSVLMFLGACAMNPGAGDRPDAGAALDDGRGKVGESL